ncbi:hypothetical protein WA158_000127 [Blastocystis sp. Blastoise]
MYSLTKEDDPTTLFITDYPDSWDNAPLQKYFSQFGEIEDIYVKHDKAPTRSTTYAFVKYKDTGIIEKALSIASHSIDGVHLIVQNAKKREKKGYRPEPVKRIQEVNTRVFIKKCPKFLTEEKLMNHFSQYGKVENVFFYKNPDGSRGDIAFVNFTSEDDAKKAVEADNVIEGEHLMVSIAITKSNTREISSSYRARPREHRVTPKLSRPYSRDYPRRREYYPPAPSSSSSSYYSYGAPSRDYPYYPPYDDPYYSQDYPSNREDRYNDSAPYSRQPYPPSSSIPADSTDPYSYNSYDPYAYPPSTSTIDTTTDTNTTNNKTINDGLPTSSTSTPYYPNNDYYSTSNTQNNAYDIDYKYPPQDTSIDPQNPSQYPPSSSYYYDAPESDPYYQSYDAHAPDPYYDAAYPPNDSRASNLPPSSSYDYNYNYNYPPSSTSTDPSNPSLAVTNPPSNPSQKTARRPPVNPSIPQDNTYNNSYSS